MKTNETELRGSRQALRPAVRRACVLLVTAAWLCGALEVTPDSRSEDRIIGGVDRAEMSRDLGLTGYCVREHYMVRNSRFQSEAEMTVAVTYKRGAGKTYQILSQRGSTMLQDSVLDKLLKEQAELSRGDVRSQAVLTSANYKMRLIGEDFVDGRRCNVLELTPRKKSPHLLKGKAWVDADDQALVRVEGTPSASISFWAGRPKIIREYEEIGGFTFAKRSHASSDTFLLGKSELSIEYSDYEVAGVPPSGGEMPAVTAADTSR